MKNTKKTAPILLLAALCIALIIATIPAGNAVAAGGTLKSFTLNESSVTLTDENKTVILVASFEFNEGVDEAQFSKAVTWQSSDTEVAAVAGGLVTAVGAGRATITATNSEGGTAECRVFVSFAEEAAAPENMSDGVSGSLTAGRILGISGGVFALAAVAVLLLPLKKSKAQEV